jgi:hypothetical protein
MIGES